MDRFGIPCQDKKGRLESVFGVLFMVEHAPADAHHHRPMPADQGGEGFLVPASREII